MRRGVQTGILSLAIMGAMVGHSEARAPKNECERWIAQYQVTGSVAVHAFGCDFDENGGLERSTSKHHSGCAEAQRRAIRDGELPFTVAYYERLHVVDCALIEDGTAVYNSYYVAMDVI
jgi:hypothetical protein